MTEIKVNGVPLPDFSPEKLEYNCAVPAGSLPEVATADENYGYNNTGNRTPGQAVITVSSSDGSRQTACNNKLQCGYIIKQSEG